jgi:predicted DNA binding CopG/RHH family protein
MAKELPQFRSEKEEAEFWDGHNSLDYIESDEPVELELDPELAARIAERSKTKRVTLRLRVSQIEAAKEIARKKDIPYQTLMRSWIAQGIERERSGGRK